VIAFAIRTVQISVLPAMTFCHESAGFGTRDWLSRVSPRTGSCQPQRPLPGEKRETD